MRFFLALGLLASLALIACGDDGGSDATPCSTTSECTGDELCIDGFCTRRQQPDAATGDACAPCGGECCPSGEVCAAGACVVPGDACTGDDDCAGDTYCDPDLNVCVPWGEPGPSNDPRCNQVIPAGAFVPTVQCELSDAPAGDPFPENMHVLSTPMVVDFGLGGRGPDRPMRPSIVATFDDGVDGGNERPTGVIRIIDGRTCEQTAELGSLQLTSHSSPPAIGDLNGDGRPEIVAFKADGGLVAFTVDDAGTWSVLWRSTLADGTLFEPTGGGWAGPSIADLDDDGIPEVMRQGMVFDAGGVLLDDSLALAYGPGVFAVVADVDQDGRVEHVQGEGVWEWAGGTWVPESWSTGGTAPGHVAVADFGAFPGANDWPAEAPEVAVVSEGQVRIQTLDGSLVFGPVAIPGGGRGGPPTIADFDGDGLREVSTAGAVNYVVLDPDCGDTRDGACASGATDGILWQQPSQDASSNVTGSSVFDFEADGRAEVVYGDECFLRVYDGETGNVVFSQFRSSCTWYENPVIADVDGDFNAEIVIGNNFNCSPVGTTDGRPCDGLDPRNVDPLHAGLICDAASDCPSGTCDEGLCRCATDEECCSGPGCADAGYVCEPPPAGTAGTGNTCRASHPRGTRGIRVYGDSADRWVNSRRIWNQHAYHVTNVSSTGTIPRTSEAALNWLDPELNDFRKNVQGDAIPGAAPDLTARASVSCELAGSAGTLTTQVCNRGAQPVGDGLSVGFYDGEPSDETLICRASTTTVLNIGQCTSVSCAWEGAPAEAPGVDVTVVADDLSENGECSEGNNRGVMEGVVCAAPAG